MKMEQAVQIVELQTQVVNLCLGMWMAVLVCALFGAGWIQENWYARKATKNLEAFKKQACADIQRFKDERDRHLGEIDQLINGPAGTKGYAVEVGNLRRTIDGLEESIKRHEASDYQLARDLKAAQETIAFRDNTIGDWVAKSNSDTLRIEQLLEDVDSLTEQLADARDRCVKAEQELERRTRTQFKKKHE